MDRPLGRLRRCRCRRVFDLLDPLASGFEKLNLIDESYWQLVGDEKNIQLLASGAEEGAPRPLLWTREEANGRIFVSIPGHYTWTFDDPLFRILILRGIAWTARAPIDTLVNGTAPQRGGGRRGRGQ